MGVGVWGLRIGILIVCVVFVRSNRVGAGVARTALIGIVGAAAGLVGAEHFRIPYRHAHAAVAAAAAGGQYSGRNQSQT